MCNFSMNTALFRRHACRPAAFLTVRCGQTERKPSLADFKLHAARVRVIVRQLAGGRIFAAVLGQPVPEVGVVGADIDGGFFLVKVDFGGLFLLRKPCSHKFSFLRPCYAIGMFFGCFLRLLTWGKRRFFNGKRSGDTFLVRSVPSVKYAFFPALDRQS